MKSSRRPFFLFTNMTIIIPVRTDASRLTRTLKSLVSTMDKPYNHEWIIVDDASDSLVHMSDLHPLDDIDDVELVRNNERLGPGVIRDRWIRKAKHDVILTLDSHMLVMSGCPDVNKNPFTVECVPTMEYDSFGGRMALGAQMHGYVPAYQTVLPSYARHDHRAPWNCIHGGFYYISKHWFIEADPFRGLIGYGAEEQAISMAIAAGLERPALNLSVTVAHESYGYDATPERITRMKESARNRLVLMNRWFGIREKSQVIQGMLSTVYDSWPARTDDEGAFATSVKTMMEITFPWD